MDILVLTIIAGSVIISLSILYLILKTKNKKNIVVENIEVPVPEAIDATPPVETFIPHKSVSDHKLYEKFISTYDDGDLKFNDVPYRPGAAMTCGFGIAEGYRYYVKGTNKLWTESDPLSKRDMRWGYVRPHMGVDRAAAKPYTLKTGEIVNDPVISPFDFNRTSIVDLGDYSYGTLISLYNDEYQFEFRIAHMHPYDDMLPWSFNRISQGLSFEQGWLLGQSGTYGYSSGAHTHTEIKSYDDKCEVFEVLLEELYGEKALKEYSSAQIIKEYKKQTHFEKASERVILEDWDAWKKKKKIVFANQYKIARIDPLDNKTIRTWYSSYLLFNKL